MLKVQQDAFLRLDARGGCDLIKTTEMKKTKEVVFETQGSKDVEKQILTDVYKKALRIVPKKGTLSSFSVYINLDEDAPKSITLEVNYKIIDRIKDSSSIMCYSHSHLAGLKTEITKVKDVEGHLILLNDQPFLYFTFLKENKNKGPILRKLNNKNIFEIFKVLDFLVEYSLY